MPIDIANMIVNIKAAQDFYWGNFCAAGFGALSAYWLNRRSEDKKENEINKQNFKRLYYMTSDVLSTALADRKNIIDDYYNKSLINYNNLSDYKDKILIEPVFLEYKYYVDYSLIFLDKESKYVILLVEDIRKQVERFNKTVKLQGELIDYFDKREYKSFEEFEKDGKLKENIVKVIEALNKNSNILICLTYALMTILDSYRLKTMQNEEFVNIKIDQKQVNAILKDPETLKDIPEDIKEGFSFFTNKQNNICPE